ncbi:MAG: ABC transporter ATP-binding protein [Alphaproteobacteria bacterium]|jgi:putrescine transport system ATP-binding protein|nr:ABC transporter ATP-binding protein [Alphaproteobacteria bacterium]
MAKIDPKTSAEPWRHPEIAPYIRIDHVSKDFDGIPALNNVSLSVYKGELFSLLGASGCGKTTLLRLLAGFETASSGRVFIDGVDMTLIPPYERPVNMMFQSYALFPHMTVEQNVAFGLKQDGFQKSIIKKRVENMLEMVGMEKYLKRRPAQLSGGQRQRVALARSLVKQPKLLLLDEPLGALDRQLREKAQFEIVNIQETLGVTFIMVTHDQEEAMTMSTRVCVMEEGRVRQVGTPTEVYEYPNSRMVADFLGEMNIFEGIIIEEETSMTLVKCPGIESDFYISHAVEAPVGASVAVAIRPEKVMVSKEPHPVGRNCVRGIVDDIAYLGDVSIYHVILPSGLKVLACMTNQVRLAERPINWEDEVYLYWRPENGVILTA